MSKSMVWVVIESLDYETQVPVAVFTTEPAAKACVEKHHAEQMQKRKLRDRTTFFIDGPIELDPS